ncbi:MAG: hypothetical protein AAFX06_13680 [Planctomycetota bacterium]
MLLTSGCGDDAKLVREIQSKRQQRQQSRTQQDHLGEIFALLRNFVDLDAERARKQIAFHLNRWKEGKSVEAGAPAIVRSLRDVIPTDALEPRIEDPDFQPSDSQHLRDCFLFRSIYSWVDKESQDDALLTDWFASVQDELGEEGTLQLQTATRLFDWTVRSIALEPAVRVTPAPAGPKFPLGMTFRGAGYRQSDFETVVRGTGDGLQRAGVFTQLCRQAGIPAAVLATIDSTTGKTTPFCVGVRIGKDIYLFEPTLGVFVPGPDQVGIATLAQARTNPLVLRRLGIAGLDQFKYTVTKDDVQQCAALLNLLPESISPRMKLLQSGLTGDRRMSVYTDADQVAEQFDEVTGISSVRLWDVPVLAEVYRATCNAHAERDPAFAFWYFARWAMMDADSGMAKNLKLGRWRHLIGQFADDEDEGTDGARTLYLAQRAPEFEIEDLRIDPDLQKAYGIRRELGMDSRIYDQQVQQVQAMMRLGKRTATYWLSLLQADDDRQETAESWIRKRVLDDQQMSYWVPAARYNMARLAERLGDAERAIEIYKEPSPQEHGNRIRARLVTKQLSAKAD